MGSVSGRVLELLFLGSAVAMTVIEYIAGLLCLKVLKVHLWDYRNDRGNNPGHHLPQILPDPGGSRRGLCLSDPSAHPEGAELAV